MRLTAIFITTIIAVSMLGCDNNDGENPTYTISRKGEFYTDRQYDVIHVYGFGRNGEVAKDITEFLNRSEPNTYTFRRDE